MHEPVLLNEALDNLRLFPGGIFVDCTLGGAGHAREIMKRIQPGGILLGFDQDKDALHFAAERLQQTGGKFQLFHANFRYIRDILQQAGFTLVDGIIFDIGVSSYQLENPERGFSYQNDAPLDMRMDQEGKFTAAQLVNLLPIEELAEIIKEYGEERWAKRIAEFIGEERVRRPILTTGHLVEIIKAAIPAKARQEGPHPAKRTFQALRIAVNQELDALKEALEGSISLLRPGGRICVITFHSLEDRIVKNFFQAKAKGCICPPRLPVCTCGKKKEIKIITSKPIIPSDEEIKRNHRARSAKLRVAERI